MLDRVGARHILIDSECERSNQPANHPANEEFTGTKMIFLREYEVSTVGEDGKEDIEISEE